MVATAERITPNLQESGFTLADLPIVATNYAFNDSEGYIAATNYQGLAKDLAARKNMPLEDLIGHFQTTLNFVSLLAPEQETPAPIKLEHLITVWDVTYQLVKEKAFGADGNIGELDPKTVFDNTAQRRGRTEEQMQEHVAGSKRFLSEFIEANTQ